jgi:parvulin-like peptidyl-prolyl isomerase
VSPVSHVLVTTEAEARAVLASLEGGESFGDAARAQSTDTGSAESGGFLGCLQPGQFVPEFESAAENATAGDPVGPVQTEFGYHVLLVGPPSFEQLGPRIAQAIKDGAAIQQAIAEMEVTVNPRFGEPGGAQPDQQTGALQYVLRQPDVPSVATGRDATTTTTIPLAG